MIINYLCIGIHGEHYTFCPISDITIPNITQIEIDIFNSLKIRIPNGNKDFMGKIFTEYEINTFYADAINA